MDIEEITNIHIEVENVEKLFQAREIYMEIGNYSIIDVIAEASKALDWAIGRIEELENNE